MSWDAQALRRAFTRYFVERGHTALPAAGLVPHDPTVLFNIAGMVQFKPYFEGIEKPPVPRATTIQPCFRTVDIDIVGTTARHNTFFEMLGNFSFGDYFKELAIPYAWELVTEGYGFDPDRLWITVHESDTDASGIWMDTAHVDPERIQRMGDDNFWKMGETGPCGPSSEIFYDKGERFGPAGGPAHGGEDRYVEIWNLVFMQYERHDDGSLVELPKKNIDTGAGLERNLAILQGVDSIFETSVLAPLVDEAGRLTGHPLGGSEAGDAALRILADHARAATFLISDGVFPSNDGRGYVLRRVIRRAVLRAHQLGVAELVAPPMCDAVVAVMGEAYPNLSRDRQLVEKVVAHEEEAFLRTLRAGTALIEEELGRGDLEIAGDVAFKLHDTYGFPIELTTELAEGRGVRVDRVGFDAEMSAQRDRARLAGKAVARGDEGRFFADLRATFGPTQFVGYRQTSARSRVLALRPRDDAATFTGADGEPTPDGVELLDVVLDVTPFYAEGGGQIGDTGTIATASATLRVLDTTATAEGVTRHTGYLLEGELAEGAEATASIDVARRDAIRRNHTATHLLHAALRRVLGEHAKQQGSLVAPDRLRFDFNHFAPLSADELDAIERQVNEAVLSDIAVRTYETSRQEAERTGAMAFFGEKYGDVVRVVEADDLSVELCGGTHVAALGMIGPFRIISEASIGANTRRIEAITGERSLDELRGSAAALAHAAQLLKTSGPELPAAIEKMLARQRALEDELGKVRASQRGDDSRTLAAAASGGVVVARRDGLDATALRELALAVRNADGVDAVGLVGTPEPGRVALVVATRTQSGIDARPIAAAAASAVGGGGGGSPELATAGGRDVNAIDAALERLRAELGVS